MKIELRKITIGELAENYQDGYQGNEEKGVIGYGGKLDIRPAYQRNFIYTDKQREAVITTIKNNFPLNVMYWAKRDDNDEVPYEIIDGQQRTISICQYVNGEFAYDFKYFHNLTAEEKEQILKYELMVYVCSGSDKDKLDWFRVINIAGEKLTEQELRNAIYSGTWVNDAKRYFSKNGCAAYSIANKYLSGSVNRQDYLETAIKWINNGNIEAYMARHQHDQNANELWLYFQNVISWVELTFREYYREMKGIDWGTLYNKFNQVNFNTDELKEKVARLMQDSDVTNKKGVFTYVLSGEERSLNIRTFDDNMKREVYERQQGVCPICGRHYEIEEMEADHITPWSQGGRTIAENCQMLCRECNRRKSDK